MSKEDSVNTKKNLLNAEVTTDKAQQEKNSQIIAEVDAAIKMNFLLENTLKSTLQTIMAPDAAAQLPNPDAQKKQIDASNDTVYAKNANIDSKNRLAVSHGVFTQAAQGVVNENIGPSIAIKNAFDAVIQELNKLNNEQRKVLTQARSLLKSSDETKPNTTSSRNRPG